MMTLALFLAAAPAAAQVPGLSARGLGGHRERAGSLPDRGLREAAAANASAVYLDIDTPGGRVDAAERIADAVGAPPCPSTRTSIRARTARARSSALSSKAIYMRPGAVLGAATPVDGGGTRPPRRWSRRCAGSSERWRRHRGLDPAWPKRWWTSGSRCRASTAGPLLTLSTNEALRVGYAKGGGGRRGGAAPRPSGCRGHASYARAELGGAGRPLPHQPARLPAAAVARRPRARVRDQDRGVRARRAGEPASRSASSSGRAFCVGLAGWEEVILLGVGLVAISIEVFVLPGFGAAGILGIVALGPR